MDPNLAMETATEGAKAVTKFQEILQKIFGPQWTKNQADADAYADEKKLKTIRENSDMDIKYVDGKMSACKKTPEALAYRAERRMTEDSIRQEKNLEDIFEITSQEIQQEENVSDTPVDDDWLSRFLNIAKDVNSQGMRYIWAKILSGEIKKPGSFSLRTLETIRNMTKEEAEIFQKIMPLVVNIGEVLLVTSKSNILNKHNITYDSILALDECGLINSARDLTFGVMVAKNRQAIIHTQERMVNIIGTNDKDTEISIDCYPVTKAGKELYGILDHIVDNEYLVDLASDVYTKNRGKAIISIYAIDSISGNTINYKEDPIITFGEDVNIIS